MKHYNIPIFIVHYGCPHICVFCNQKKITGVETNITSNDIDLIIKEYLKTLPEDSYKEVAFFGGSFTGISIKLQKQYLDVVQPYIKSKKINGIRMSTRPDYISKEILDLLKEYSVTTIELGVQSFDDEVLEKSERGYKNEVIYEASNLIKEYGINLGIQIMPGLPGSNFEKDILSIKEIVKIHPNEVRIYPTLVITETELEKMYARKEYKPLELEEAVEQVVPMVALLELNDIKIIRTGLQPSDDLREEGVVVGGPFHSAFRELVETEIYYKFFNILLRETEVVKVECNEKNTSRIIGINKKNKVRLGEKFKISRNDKLERNEILINLKKYTRKQILDKIIKESGLE